MVRILILAMLAVMANAGGNYAVAASCLADNKTRVKANDACLVIQAYGEPAERTSLVVFLHGDTKRIANQLFPMAKEYGSKGIVSVGLIRPGYSDTDGNQSTGRSFRNRGDNYASSAIDPVAAAVKELKNFYNAEFVVLAGRSGGSAIAALIIAKYPGLADAVVLGACPCNVPQWRSMRGKGAWGASLSPHNYVDEVPKATKVIAVTGSKDSNTFPFLAKDYVSSLKDNGVDATYIEVPGASHGRIEHTGEFKGALASLLEGRSLGPLEPTSEESDYMLSIKDEHFTNALARFRAAGDCRNRGKIDAESVIREMISVYRKKRDTSPDFAIRVLRSAIDYHFQIADAAVAANCADVADNQYRTIKRLLRNVEFPDIQERLKAATGK